MKKITIILFLLLTISPKNIHAQGIYTCRESSTEGCIPVNSCDSGYEPGTDCDGYRGGDPCPKGIFDCVKIKIPEESSFLDRCPDGESIDTAIGCINIVSIQKFIQAFVKWGMGISGGTALLLFIYSSFLTSTSEGDPRKLRAGQELLISAIAGVIMLIFSIFLLRFMGVSLLGIF